MAHGIENAVNADGSDLVNYPNKTIKDNLGAGDGTPVDVAVYGDLHQFMRKLLTDANITPNGLADNVTNGYQYSDALTRLKTMRKDIVIISANITLTSSDLGKTIHFAATSDITITLPLASTCLNGVVIRFFKAQNNTFKLTLVSNAGDSIAISEVLATQYDSICLAVETSIDGFVVESKNIKYLYPKTIIQKCINEAYSTSSFVIKFATTIKDDDNLFNTTTGKFIPNVAGLYEINYSVCLIDADISAISNYLYEVAIYKNGVFENITQATYPVTVIGSAISFSESWIVQANGTTDEFTIKVTVTSARTGSLSAGFTAKFIER